MSSSAFSVKKFDTKSPAICKPPPLPPFVPQPPKDGIIFYVATEIRADKPGAQAHFAAALKCYHVPFTNFYRGQSQPTSNGHYVEATIQEWPNLPSYALTVHFHVDAPYGALITWDPNPFQASRPYVGERLVITFPYRPDHALAVVREVPF